MILERIDLTHIRNIRRAQLEFSPALNLLVGANGAGKTAFLESIHLLVRARSFRSGGLNSLITQGEDSLLVRAEGRQLDVVSTLAVQKIRQQPVRLRHNQTEVRQVSRMAARMPIQVLLPNLADLVFGSPAVRRQWLDWGVFHLDNDYIATLSAFQRSLRQRNAALRQQNRASIDVWTKRFATCAEAVTRKRASYLEAIRPPFQSAMSKLLPNTRIELEFQPGWMLERDAENLDKLYRRELKYGYSQYGPHRAEIRLRLRAPSDSSSPRNAARVLSRGQGKCVASAMKLAQVAMLQQQGLETVFLMDDVASELDLEHAQRFLDLLRTTSSQVIATTVEGSAFAQTWQDSSQVGDRLFHVRSGRFSHVEG